MSTWPKYPSRESLFTAYCTWKTVVLLSKGDGDFRRIGITEVLWNSLSGDIKQLIVAEITYHDILHGLQAVRVMGTASLEAKLIHQLMTKKRGFPLRGISGHK